MGDVIGDEVSGDEFKLVLRESRRKFHKVIQDKGVWGLVSLSVMFAFLATIFVGWGVNGN